MGTTTEEWELELEWLEWLEWLELPKLLPKLPKERYRREPDHQLDDEPVPPPTHCRPTVTAATPARTRTSTRIAVVGKPEPPLSVIGNAGDSGIGPGGSLGAIGRLGSIGPLGAIGPLVSVSRPSITPAVNSPAAELADHRVHRRLPTELEHRTLVGAVEDAGLPLLPGEHHDDQVRPEVTGDLPAGTLPPELTHPSVEPGVETRLDADPHVRLEHRTRLRPSGVDLDAIEHPTRIEHSCVATERVSRRSRDRGERHQRNHDPPEHGRERTASRRSIPQSSHRA